MPTDLPPDYKPAPKPTSDNPGATVPPPPAGEDSRDPGGSVMPGQAGLPGREGDSVDPGWGEPATAPAGAPAMPGGGLPSF